MSSHNYILATEKPWHDELFSKLEKLNLGKWTRVFSKEDLQNAIDLNPKAIFFPHWSHLIPKSIIENQPCVIFHMTDLPFGRGGSPLQNLIVSGKTSTVISAIKADQGLDTGPIYLKRPLSLEGSAQEIFERSAVIIQEMIQFIINEQPTPKPQEGDPVIFKRRTPDMSSIVNQEELEDIYDFIRMLDADGYPHAFLETNSFKLEFRNAQLDGKEVTANVRFIKK